MLLIGHRGCAYPGYNQNTIRSFEKVTSEGVPAIEFDVQLCADGRLVVVHNLDLEEVSTGTGEVSNTDSTTLKALYAGDPGRGKDRIPFLEEVFDFFASKEPGVRPVIHMELKGKNTGTKAGELFNQYVDSGKLEVSDMLASSFNWDELRAFREVCPTAGIALLDGAIRRDRLIEKTGPQGEALFGAVFAYGNEDYMLPRFPDLAGNQALVEKTTTDEVLSRVLIEEIQACLEGRYYTDELLETAVEMRAASVNLWYKTISADFVAKAHARGLAVFVYTVNTLEEWQTMLEMKVDGVFTDFYAEAKRSLGDSAS